MTWANLDTTADVHNLFLLQEHELLWLLYMLERASFFVKIGNKIPSSSNKHEGNEVYGFVHS